MNISVKTEDVFRNTIPLLLCPLDLSKNLGNLACLDKWNYCSVCVAMCLLNLNIGSHTTTTWVRCLHGRSRQEALLLPPVKRLDCLNTHHSFSKRGILHTKTFSSVNT